MTNPICACHRQMKSGEAEAGAIGIGQRPQCSTPRRRTPTEKVGAFAVAMPASAPPLFGEKQKTLSFFGSSS